MTNHFNVYLAIGLYAKHFMQQIGINLKSKLSTRKEKFHFLQINILTQ